jgi:hypothetical protein
LEYNNNVDLQEMGCGDTEWIELVQDRGGWRALVNEVMNLRIPKFGEIFEWLKTG